MPPSRPVAKRHKRGIGEETVGLHVAVPPATRVRVNEVTGALKITSGRYVEILVARDQAISDERGVPHWAQAGMDLNKTMPLPEQAPTSRKNSAA